jgi:hypothetical protein
MSTHSLLAVKTKAALLRSERRILEELLSS